MSRFISAVEGPRAGQPILFLHGFYGDSSLWDDLVAGLLQTGRFACQRMDLPGHGQAQRCTARWPELLQRLDGWIRSCHQPPTIIGYSMGARVLRQLLLTPGSPLRRAVLIAPHPGLPPAAARRRRLQDDQLAAWLCAHGAEAGVERWAQLPIFAGQTEVPDHRLKRQQAMRLRQVPRGLAHSLRCLGSGSCAVGGIPLRDAQIELIYGSRLTTDVARARALARTWPDAQSTPLSPCGHNPILEAPQALLQQILAPHLGGRSISG